MDPRICEIVSRLFYDGRLVTSPLVVPTAGPALVWRDTSAYSPPELYEEIRHADGGVCNRGEAMTVAYEYWACNSGTCSILVLSTYAEQVAAMRDMFSAELDETHATFNPRLRVMTVDAALGTEADVVILSLVRANPQGRVGFSSCPRRACVAISRARQHMIIVGHAPTYANTLWAHVFRAYQLSLEQSQW